MRGDGSGAGPGRPAHVRRVAANTAVAVAVAIVMLAVGCDRSDHLPSSSPSEPGASLPDPSQWSWSVVNPAVGPEVPGLELVAASANGFAATGAGERPTLWTSPDGGVWAATPANGLEGSTLLDLQSLANSEYLAAGFVSERGGVFARFDATAANVSIVGGPSTIITSIVPSIAGDVAAGGRLDNSSTAQVWRSSDATTWTVADGPGPALFGPVDSGRHGWVAASNFSLPEAGNGRADIWLSTDASTWLLSTSISDASIEGLQAIDDGFVAVGRRVSQTGDLLPALWRTGDGRSWDRIELGDVEGTMSEVIRWRDGYVAVGSSLDGGPGGLIWISRDGMAWTAAAGVGLKGMRLRDAAASADRLVIVGEKAGMSLVLLADLPN